MALPRGIKNNNPLNIRISATKWQGKDTPAKDSAFETFISPEYGIRAAAKNLLTYEERGINTLRGIINTWAPPSENDTGAYLNYVCKMTGIGPDDALTLDDYDTLKNILKAMIGQENGFAYLNYYSEKVWSDALRKAGVFNVPKQPVSAAPETKLAAATATSGVVTLAAAASTIQVVQPTFGLLQTMISAAPWVAGLIAIGVACFLIFLVYNRYKKQSGV